MESRARYNSPRRDRRSGAQPDPDSARLLLAAERAVDLGAGILRRGRSHIGALIGKGDRDFATDVDVHLESAVRASLAIDVPEISFLGEEDAGEEQLGRASWVLDPIDGTINFARDSPLCAISLSLVIGGQPVLGIVDVPLLGERFIARQGAGAYLNGTRISVAEVAGLREAIVGVADFKVGVGSEEENRVHLAVVARLARASLGPAPPPPRRRGRRRPRPEVHRLRAAEAPHQGLLGGASCRDTWRGRRAVLRLGR